MLIDLLLCFLGRQNGFELFLTCGEPFDEHLPTTPARGARGRGGPIWLVVRLGLVGVSRGGDASNISDRDIEVDFLGLLSRPLENLNGGGCGAGDLPCELYALVRINEGLSARGRCFL